MKQYRIVESGIFQQDKPEFSPLEKEVRIFAEYYEIDEKDLVFLDSAQNEIYRVDNYSKNFYSIFEQGVEIEIKL